MKLREIFRFELRYQLRRITTWLCFVLLFLFAFLIGAGSPSNDEVLLRAPFFTAFATVLAGGIWLFIAASIAGEAAARDVATGMHPLTFTAPASRAEYLGGRFLAAFALNALILLAVPAGLLLTLLLPVPEGAAVAPFRPAAYLTSYGFIALPYAFAASAIQFSFAALLRRPMASYLGTLAIVITSHFGLLIVANLLDRWELLQLLDLVGFGSILFVVESSWTPLDMNTRLLGLEPTLLVNRAIWLAIAAGVLAFTWNRFRLAHPDGRVRRRAARAAAAVPASAAGAQPARGTRIALPDVPRPFGLATAPRQALAIAWASFRWIARSRAVHVLGALFALHLVVFMPEHVRFMGVPMLPATDRVLELLTAAVRDVRTPLILVPLLIAFLAGELYWRERDAGVCEMVDASPVPEWALFLGKLLGLGLVVAAWLLLVGVAAMGAQLAMGYRDLQPLLYLQVLFGLQLPEYLLFACLALVLHALVHHRYLGHVATILALVVMGFAASFGIRHDLLSYGASPAWSYSDMAGFGASLAPWLWFKLYWAAWALLLATAAALLWVRGREERAAARLRGARGRLAGAMLRVATTAVLLILGLGGFVFYNTNVLNRNRTSEDAAERAAAYERRYGRYAGVPQPSLVATGLAVDIDPGRRRLDIRATYRLVNRSAARIVSIHVATVPGVRTDAIVFDRAARAVLTDDAHGHRIYALEQPLAPGEALMLRFRVREAPRGFAETGAEGHVVANGTHFGNGDLLPAIGYQPQRALRDRAERRKHGLDTPPWFPPSLYDEAARSFVGSSDPIMLDVILSTSPDQVAIAPGTLRREWTEGGRRHFHYATDAPIRNEYRIFSAAYEVHEASWQDVAIQVFHHPGHTANLERMVRSIRTSLAHYTREFGPYPYRHIRFIERPGGGGGMSADASSIAFDEGFTHFDPAPADRGLDLPFYVVAHEVAHQWWGTQVSSALVEGAWLMSESLAVYSGMQVLREGYGQDQVRRYLDLVRSIYARPRSRAAVPLLRADESFLGYRKGPVALYALARYIGEDRVNAALRQLVRRHAWQAPPLPTSLDLYRELKAVTPDSLRPLLHDLFEVNAYWQLETRTVDAVQTKAGQWQVTLTVRARKVVVDGAGAETEVPMNDLVEIGVFAPVASGEHVLKRPLHLGMHRLRSGEQTITLLVPSEPERGGIDPYHLLIDLATEDNVQRTKQSLLRSPDFGI